MNKIDLITITGPTASGKTGFAAHLAHRLGGEIISADSRQVYRNMNLGTGKDYGDYLVEDQQIPYHLIDIKDPGYKYNVYEFQQDFHKAYEDITGRGALPFLVGGTGMYIEAVTKGYKLLPVPVNPGLREKLQARNLEELVQMLLDLRPDLHNSTDTKNKKRTIRAIEIARYYAQHEEEASHFPEIDTIILGIELDRDMRRKRISERLQARIREGMIDEVAALLTKVDAKDLIFYGLEYKFITLYLIGELTREEMVRQLESAIHQFAKRQMTWFRKMERSGVQIHWIDGHVEMTEKLERAEKIIEEYPATMQNITKFK
jgi:tRNA dimethylallyltransferase